MALVIPHLGYAISYWCPYIEKGIAELEKVERRAMKLIPETHVQCTLQKLGNY